MDFFHYTLANKLQSIMRTGVFNNDSNFTSTEYFSAWQAGNELGINPHNIDCVLKFTDDGKFIKKGNVQSSNRFSCGGIQYEHPSRPKPVAMRKIAEKTWISL
jgi:hypothetical protein